MDTIMYAITGVLTAVIVAVPAYALCLGAEWLYKNNEKFHDFIDKIA